MKITRMEYSTDLADIWATTGDDFDESDAGYYHHLCQLFAREIKRLQLIKSAEVAAEMIAECLDA